MNTENKAEQPIDFKSLSSEERKALKAQWAAEEKAEKAERAANVQALKEIGLEFLETNIDSLVLAQEEMEKTVANVFKSMSSHIDLKAKIYGLEKLDQDSHTITHPEGNCSITIGYNAGISFDGTETAGVQKIMDYITGLSGDAEDENAQKLFEAVKFLLKPNFKTGMLNPGRIIQLNQMRKTFNSPEFDEGMDIIIDAQNKTKGSTYVSGYKHVDMGDGITKKLEFRFTT
jgi:hypothetical protein